MKEITKYLSLPSCQYQLCCRRSIPVKNIIVKLIFYIQGRLKKQNKQNHIEQKYKLLFFPPLVMSFRWNHKDLFCVLKEKNRGAVGCKTSETISIISWNWNNKYFCSIWWNFYFGESLILIIIQSCISFLKNKVRIIKYLSVIDVKSRYYFHPQRPDEIIRNVFFDYFFCFLLIKRCSHKLESSSVRFRDGP